MSKIVTFRCPDDLAADLYAVATERGSTVTEAVIAGVRMWLSPPKASIPVGGNQNAPKAALASPAKIAAEKAAQEAKRAGVPYAGDIRRAPLQKTGMKK